MSTRINGTVKFFNIRKGWGFILGEDDREYFVHHSSISSNAPYKCLQDGEKVTFVDGGIKNGKNDPIALEVRSVTTGEVSNGTDI